MLKINTMETTIFEDKVSRFLVHAEDLSCSSSHDGRESDPNSPVTQPVPISNDMTSLTSFRVSQVVNIIPEAYYRTFGIPTTKRALSVLGNDSIVPDVIHMAKCRQQQYPADLPRAGIQEETPHDVTQSVCPEHILGHGGCHGVGPFEVAHHGVLQQDDPCDVTHEDIGHQGQFSQPYCYDIDLDMPAISDALPRDCVEADSLTPTLLPCGLGQYLVLVNGSEVQRDEACSTAQCPDTGDYTEIKPRPPYSNSDSAFEDMSDVSVTSTDGWDTEIDLGCVNYSDVHMEMLTAPPDVTADYGVTWRPADPGDAADSAPDIKQEVEDGAASTTSLPAGEADGAQVKLEPKLTPPRTLKRPKNGFIRFAMRFRKEVAMSHPRLDNRDISRILGVRWRKLSPEEKMDYEEAFHDEMQARKADHPEWRYGGSRQHEDISSWEPIPTRLRPRDKLKRRKIPKMTRHYTRRKACSVIQTNWVQCDRCNKWRQLPLGVNMDDIPAQWFCEYNWAPKNFCDAEEDQEDPEEELLTQRLNHIKDKREEFGYGMSDFVSF